MEQYHIVTITLKEVLSTCTINGQPGYGTVLGCSDQEQDIADGTASVVDKDYKFTDYNGAIFESPVWKCVKSVSETTPTLKGGNGLASRATASIVFRDFQNQDPNPDSGAVTANPEIINQGTFFGKLEKRNIIKNSNVKIEKYETDGFTHTKVSEVNYLGVSLKYTKNQQWTLSCKDILSRTNVTTSQFPKEINEVLVSSISDSDTTVTITNNNNLVSGDLNGECITIGQDTMLVTGVAFVGGNWQLTVTRQSSITVGTGTTSRNYENTPAAASAGDAVFVGRVYEDVPLANLLVAILDQAGIPPGSYNVGDINIEINNWLVYTTFSYIFNEPRPTDEVLDELSKTFLLDIYSEDGDTVKVLANTPWKTTVRTLQNGIDYDFDSIKWNSDEDRRVTSTIMRYNKKDLSSENDQKFYISTSQAFNSVLESENFYDERKSERLVNSLFLGDSTQDGETGDSSVIRYNSRFEDPEIFDIKMNENQLNDGTTLKLGDVVELIDESRQGLDGNPEPVRVQVINIKPTYKTSREYMLKLLSYNPFSGGVTDDPITVTQNSDINLFALADSPPNAVTRTYVFDEIAYFQGLQNQTIRTGNFASGSTVNIVCTGASSLDARAGRGGAGGNTIFENGVWNPFNGTDGTNGGNVINVDSQSAITVNIYLNGNRLVDGVNYTCDGVLRSPGGGDSGFNAAVDVAGDGGNGGKGNPSGRGGFAGIATGQGSNVGTNGVPGLDNFVDYGVDGADNDGNSGGDAGPSIQDTSPGSTINVYTDGDSTRYVRNSTETNYTAD